MVTAGYFQTMAIPVVAGRVCRMTADPNQPFEILVNRSFADRYFAGRNPIGHRMMDGPPGEKPAQIVGVVADAREDGRQNPPPAVLYGCGYLRFWPDAEIYVQAANLTAVASAVQRKMREIEPSRPIYSVRPVAEALSGALSPTRFRTALISLFSVIALTLAAIGLYGVMAYLVSQRTREIGVRVALGARPGQIVGEIVRSGFTLAAAGAFAGVAIASGASRLLGTLLYGIRAYDPASYGSALAVLGGAALLACLIPGFRAASIDPTRALRE
jgi:putative ABC transport system permease protein